MFKKTSIYDVVPPNPIWVGRCVVNTEFCRKAVHRGISVTAGFYPACVGLRFLSPAATDESGYTLASDVYMFLETDELKELIGYLSTLLETVTKQED